MAQHEGAKVLVDGDHVKVDEVQAGSIWRVVTDVFPRIGLVGWSAESVFVTLECELPPTFPPRKPKHQ